METRLVNQLLLALDVVAAPVPHGPGLDTETVKRLKAIGIVYHGTHWNAWFEMWVHEIELNQGRGAHCLNKTDEGIAAMLRDGEAPL